MTGHRRARSGTLDAYRPCARCRHMSVRHLDGGTGACVQLVTLTDVGPGGRITTRQGRCTCERFTTDERLI